MAKSPTKLSPADQKAWRSLRAIWDRQRTELNLTQESAAEEFGCTQGLIGQYLNGHTALGPVAVLKFARILRVQPSDIRDDVLLGSIVPSELPQDVRQLAVKLAALPEDVRRDAIGFFNLVMKSGRYVEFVNGVEKSIQERLSNDDTDSERHEKPTATEVVRAKK